MIPCLLGQPLRVVDRRVVRFLPLVHAETATTCAACTPDGLHPTTRGYGVTGPRPTEELSEAVGRSSQSPHNASSAA